jgi:hypothetical protein
VAAAFTGAAFFLAVAAADVAFLAVVVLDAAFVGLEGTNTTSRSNNHGGATLAGMQRKAMRKGRNDATF